MTTIQSNPVPSTLAAALGVPDFPLAPDWSPVEANPSCSCEVDDEGFILACAYCYDDAMEAANFDPMEDERWDAWWEGQYYRD